MKRKIVYVDMDGVLADFYGAHAEAIKRNPKNQFPQSEHGFFRNLKPIPNAIMMMEWLQYSKKHDVYILTAPSVMNPMCYTEKMLWVREHLGPEMVNRLIISPVKGLNKGDYLIDDNILGKGQEDFEGEIIHFGSDKFKNWTDVIIYLAK